MSEANPAPIHPASTSVKPTTSVRKSASPMNVPYESERQKSPPPFATQKIYG